MAVVPKNMEKIKALLGQDRLELANMELISMLQADRSAVRRNMWRFVRKMVFNPQVPSARIELKNTTMELGPVFFQKMIADYSDLQFLILHERSHIFLHKYLYYNLSNFLPQKGILNAGDLNFLEDSVVNAMCYKLLRVEYSLPDKAYIGEGHPDIESCLTKHLQGEMLQNGTLVALHTELYAEPFNTGKITYWLLELAKVYGQWKREMAEQARQEGASISISIEMPDDALMGQDDSPSEAQGGISIEIQIDSQENEENATEGEYGASEGQPEDSLENHPENNPTASEEDGADGQEDNESASGQSQPDNGENGDDEQEAEGQNGQPASEGPEEADGENPEKEASGKQDEPEDGENEENGFSFGENDGEDFDEELSEDELKVFDALKNHIPLVDDSEKETEKENRNSTCVSEEEAGQIATKKPNGCQYRKFPQWDVETGESAIENELIRVTSIKEDKLIIADRKKSKRIYDNRIMNMNTIAQEFQNEFSLYGNSPVITGVQMQMPSGLSRRDAFSLGTGYIPAMWQKVYHAEDKVRFDIWADVSGSMDIYMGMIPVILRQLGHLAGDVWNFSTQNVNMNKKDYHKYLVTTGGTDFDTAFEQIVKNKNPYIVFISDGQDSQVCTSRHFMEFLKFKRRLVYIWCRSYSYEEIDHAGLCQYADKVITIHPPK